MTSIPNLNETPGNTPLRPDDSAQLIPNLATRKELDEWERTNILAAQSWAFNPGIEIASLPYKSNKGNGVALPPHSNWYQLVPTFARSGWSRHCYATHFIASFLRFFAQSSS